MQILKNHNVDDEVCLVAALLHDVLEDTDTKVNELNIFGEEVIDVVVALTRNENEKEKLYLERVKNNDKACLIKIADRISNLEDLPLSQDLDFMNRYYINTKEKYIKLSKGTVLENMMNNEVIKLREIIGMHIK